MIRVAICDDEPNSRSYLASLVRKQGAACEIAEYASAQDCLADESAFDLLFLDIELGQPSDGTNPAANAFPVSLDGLGLARRLRCMDLARQPLIIFVTGYDRYVFDAFDVEAFQYLVKPVDEERFADVFRRAAKRLADETLRQPKPLVIQQSGARKVVPLDNIYYIESQGHKILLHLKEGTAEYYGKIGELEDSLRGHFCRIHKGYLVNLSYVEEYTRTAALLSNGDSLAISKYKYDAFVKAHLRFLQ